jgi:hypothetical protein
MIYIYDRSIISTTEVVKELMEAFLSKSFKVKSMGEINNLV